MAKDNTGDGDLPSTSYSTPSLSSNNSNRSTHRRTKPYDPNNSFVKKVASKVTDLIPQRSWISKWFNTSQDEIGLRMDDDPEQNAYDECDNKQIQASQPPLKRPCIRMDVTHPPGTFAIKIKPRPMPSDLETTTASHYCNHNDTTQNFMDPPGTRLQRFVASTPAVHPSTSSDVNKIADTRTALNLLMSEQSNISTANGMDDNSESSESTSGSSSVPQNRQETQSTSHFSSPFVNRKRYIDEKLNYTNHLQSPRSLILDNTTRDSLSSRRPSFNASLVSSNLERTSSMASPFYSGNTVFGGANAANLYRSGSSLLTNASMYLNQSKAPKRTKVQVNPSNKSSVTDLSGMSQTARRILEALEQFSSPISDAKKIPIRNTSSILTPSFSRKRGREDDEPSSNPKIGLRHLARDLAVPTVPDMLRIRRRQRLQDTTVAARKIVTASNATKSQEYQLRTENSPQTKRNSEFKAKKKTNLEEQETIESLNLPSIPLPISTLPKFDIALPPKSAKSPQVLIEKPSLNVTADFKFASPIKLPEGNKNFESVSNFTFSKPLSPSKASSTESKDPSKTLNFESNNNFSPKINEAFPNFVWNGPTSEALKPKEKLKEKEITNTDSKVGSVLDYLMAKKQTEVVWECSECLIKNQGNNIQCISCKTAKPKVSEIIDQGLQQTVKLAEDTVHSDCKSTKVSTDVNLLSNKSSISAIDQESQTKSTLADNVINKPTPVNSETVKELFKPLKKSWECPCCLVMNSETNLTCVCCNTAKPGTVNIMPKSNEKSSEIIEKSASGFGDAFKKPEGSWTCDTCMIQNKSEHLKCVACETPKVIKTGGTSTSSVSIEKPNNSSGFGDKFKQAQGSWTCDTCLISNKPDINKCIACETPKSGTDMKKTETKLQVNSMSESSKFQFGINSQDAKSAQNILPKPNGFSFGNSSQTSSLTSAAHFTFGIPVTGSSIKVGDPKTDSQLPSPTFQFGLKSVEDTRTESKTVETLKPSTNTSPTTISESAPIPNFFLVSSSATKVDNKEPVKYFTLDSPKDKKENPPTNEVTSTSIFARTEKSVDNKNATQDVTKTSSNLQSVNEQTPTFTKPNASVNITPSNSTSSPISNSLISTPESTTPTPSASNAASASSLFGFSGQIKPAIQTKQALPNFGTPKTAVSATTVPMFTFTPKTNEPTLQSTTESKETLKSFGSPVVTFNTTKPSATPSLFGTVTSTPTLTTDKPIVFGSATENKIPTFGENKEQKVSVFGAPDKNTPSFGTVNKTTSVFPTATPTFGSSSASNAPFGGGSNVFCSTTSTFGSNASASTNIFSGAAKATENSSTGLFSFGSSSHQAASAASTAAGFNFSVGTNASTAEQKNNIFSFGSNAVNNNPSGAGFGSGGFNNPTTTAAGFSFNAPKPLETNAFSQGSTATPMFNAPASSTLGLGQTQPTFSVAPANAATGGFNFQNPNVSSNFSFGTPSQPSSSAASGGFNFSASGSSSSFSFDPNTQPSFNFTGGSAPKEFKASPSVMQERKIKKAVRRMR